MDSEHRALLKVIREATSDALSEPKERLTITVQAPAVVEMDQVRHHDEVRRVCVFFISDFLA